MAKITVDLDAYVIPDGHQVFKFSAGKTYRFLKAVEEANAAFLDIRGLDTLTGAPSTWADKDVLKVIAADRWDRELASRKRGNAPKSGSAKVGSHDRKVLTFLKRLFFEAKKGDLLVIPPDGYTKQVLIGEIISRPGITKRVRAKDGDYTHVFFGRSVVWRPSFEKRIASPSLLTLLHNPNAVIVLGRTLRHEIYRWAYGDFVADGRFVASFATGKAKFTAEDSAVASTWFNGLDVLRNAISEGREDQLPLSFYEMGLEKLADGVAAELRININSPGTFDLKSKDAFPFALMVMFALAGCDAKTVIDNGVTVNLKTVGAASSTPKKQIESCVNSMAIALGEARLNRACDLAERAEKDAQMSTAATLKLPARKRN